MACHPEPDFTAAQLAILDRDYIRRDRVNDLCDHCGGIRVNIRNPCPHVGCPLREALEAA